MLTNYSRCRPYRVLFAATFLFMLSGLLAPASPVYAASITVNSSADNSTAGDTFCTLREAITNANGDSDTTSGDCTAGSGSDSISIGTMTITLSSQLPAITTTVTMTGNGAANTIVQADANPNTATYRVLEVSGTGNLTLNSLTVRNGRCNGSCATNTTNGGGIYSAGTLLLDAVKVSANTASNWGGGIFSTGTLTIQNGSTIGGAGAGNSAILAGGISSSGTATIDASTVSANSATDVGGVYNSGAGTLTVQNGSLIGGVGVGNTAVNNGGGILNNGVTVIDSSTVSANSAHNGGGILTDGTLTVQNGSVIGGAGAGNSASWGGGIQNYTGTTTINASTVSANTATNNGGGVDNDMGTLIIQNGSVIGGAGTGNIAASGGGINNQKSNVYTGGSITISASIVSANTATNNGGGIHNSSNTLTIQNGSQLLNNTATTNGGALYRSAGSVSITGSCIAGNSSTSLYTSAGTQMATENWWGDRSGPGGAGPGTGDSVSAGWNYSSYLSAGSFDCGGEPYDLTVHGAAGGIALAWMDGTTDETEFRVERSPDGSTGWTEIATPAANSPSYQDISIGCWATYYYRVRAYRSTGSLFSSYTNVASAMTCAPTNLDLSQITETSANLIWTDNSSDETEFRVENSLDGTTGWVEIAQPAADSTSWPVSGLSCSTTSYYRLRAYRSAGGLYSTYTNVLKVDTIPCLVADGSLEIDTNGNYLPDLWAGVGLNLGASGDGRDCTVALIGSCSMRIKGDGASTFLFQTFYLRRRGFSTSGGAGQRFTFSAASKAQSATGSGTYQAVVTVYFDNSTTLTKILMFSGGTHDFETQAVSFTATPLPYAAVVTISYSKPGGTVWFDNVSLTSP